MDPHVLISSASSTSHSVLKIETKQRKKKSTGTEQLHG